MATADNNLHDVEISPEALEAAEIAKIFNQGPPPKLQEFAVPHLEEYFGVWAIQTDRLDQRVQMFNDLDLELHIKHTQAGAGMARASSFATMDDGQVAVITMRGEMMKAESSFGGASTVATRKKIRAAARDSSVRAIVLHIDSPGGTVAGTEDLADDVFQANKQKPVVAFIEDLGASAAYWVASQAGEIHANNSALVGSIGTFAVIFDSSKMAEDIGVKVHVVKAGDFKGAGVGGTPVTDEQLEEIQQRVNDFNELFLAGVTRGRADLSLTRVRQIADGRVHIAKRAKELALIDQVGTFEGAVRAALRMAKTRGVKAMTTNDTKTAASYGELKQALPNASAELICECLEAGFSVEEAKDHYMQELEDRNKKAESAAREAEQKAEQEQKKAEAVASGADVIEDDVSTTSSKPATAGDPIAQFEAAVQELVDQGMAKHAATAKVSVDNEELRAAYIEAYNQKHGAVRKRA